MGTVSRQREQLVHWPGGLMACPQNRRGGAWECGMSLTRKDWVMKEPKSHDKELELCYIWIILSLTWDTNDSAIYGYCFHGKIKVQWRTHSHIHIFTFYIQFRDLQGAPPGTQLNSPPPPPLKRSRGQWKILGWAEMCSSKDWPYNHWKGSTENGWKKYREHRE